MSKGNEGEVHTGVTLCLRASAKAICGQRGQNWDEKKCKGVSEHLIFAAKAPVLAFMLTQHPGLHPQQRGHRVREGILPLCPALLSPPGSPASSSGALSTGQSWSCGSGARGGPSNDVKAGTPLLGGKAGRRLQGDLRAALQYPKGPVRKLERDF